MTIGMKARLFVFSLLAAGLVSAGEAPRSRELFDYGWKFFRGEASGADQIAFKDMGWRSVDVPHDWAIEREPGSPALFQKAYYQGSGCLPGGVGWYRKTFTPPAASSGSRLFVEFEGVYMNSEVWINGHKLGTRPYGYSTFEYELTDAVQWGKPNVLSVRSQVDQPCSRWYSGAGIYRHVWLTTTQPVHVAHWGTVVTTPEVEPGKSAVVRVCTQVQNQSATPAQVVLKTILHGPDGTQAGSVETVLPVAANEKGSFDQSVKLQNPELWNLQTPVLYTAVSEVRVGEKLVDRNETPFGIRSIEFTKDRGFLLNGKRVPIKGVCLHHDQGPLGAAAYDRAIERQLEILKSMGCNGIRTSHNPPAPKLLELCDRMGFFVMDEAFDEWKKNKTKLGYGRFFDEWSERDLASLVQRDRNHPSVILWSIGNEIPEQSDGNSDRAIAQRLVDICHREDPSRPATSASDKISASLKNGFAEALDVVGINYHMENYGPLKGKFKLFASESRSTKSSRGEYGLVEQDGAIAINPQGKGQLSAYDINDGRDITAEFKLKTLAETPWVAGEFLWTGFDYIGEPVPFGWPSVSSYFGLIDLCGFPKDRFYLHQSRWSDKPMAHLLPHWNWPQFAGKPIPVWCYSNAETVELFLNGKSLGIRDMRNLEVKAPLLVTKEAKPGQKPLASRPCGWYHAEWLVPYEPGTLKVVARNGGKVVATDEVATAGKPARIELSVDRKDIQANAQDLAYVTVRIVDAEGHICPDADNLVKFSLTGPGKIAGVGNGDATCHEDLQASQRTAFHGLCLAVLQSTREPGELKLTASADGLTGDAVSVRASKVNP